MNFFPGDDTPVLAIDICGNEARFLLRAPHCALHGRSGRVPAPDPATSVTLEKILRDVAEAAGVEQKVPALVIAAPETGAWEDSAGYCPGRTSRAAREDGLPTARAQAGQLPGQADARARRRDLFCSVFTDGGSGLSLDDLLTKSPPEAFLRLCAIQRMTNGFVADTLGAAVLGIVAEPAVLSRSWRQGVLVLLAESDCLRTALVFQNRLFGVFERPWPEDINIFLRELDSFRLGWLPPEVAAASGGWVAALSALPPEAEGFQPLYIAGAQARVFQAYGQPAPGDDPAMAVCRGLAHAFPGKR